jgi:transcriptional repressor NrdR
MAQRGEFITLCRDPCSAGPSQRSLACLHSARPSDRVLQCPSCQHSDSRVLESRAADAGRSVRRRRECLNCEFRFTTYERVETMPISVVKRSGHRETFSRSKLLTGLVRACEKTGLDTSRLELLVDDIELQLQQRNQKEISSQDLGNLVLDELGELSEVAYVRFASVYGKFSGVSDFMDTLEALKQRQNVKRQLAEIS